MRWFGNLSLRSKLLTVFGPLLIVVLGQTLVTVETARDQDQAGEWVYHTLEVVDRAEHARGDVTEAVAAFRAYLLTGDPNQRLAVGAELEAARTGLADLRLLSADNPAQVERWAAILRALDAWQLQVLDPGFALRDAVVTGTATQDELIAWAAGSGTTGLEEIARLFDQAIAAEQELLTTRNDKLSDANRRREQATLLGGALALAGAIGAALFLSRDIAGAIRRLAEASTRFAGGEMQQRVRLDRRDELGRTAAAFNRMADRLESAVAELGVAAATARENEARARAITESVAEAIVVVDATGKVTWANPAVERVFGYRSAEVIGSPIAELIPEPADVFAAAPPAGARIVGTDQLVSLGAARQAVGVRRVPSGRGERLALEVVVGRLRLGDAAPDQAIAVVRDVTERTEAEARLRESEARARAHLADAERQARELALLDEVRTALARELELPEIFRTVVEAVARTLSYTHVSAYMIEGEMLVLQHQIGYDRVIDRIPTTRGISGRVARTGEAVLLEDVAADPEFQAAIEGLTSEVCVPIRDRHGVAGTLNVESVDGRRLGPADLRIVSAVAVQLGIATERARLFQAARDSEARFRSLVQHASDVIAIAAPDGTIVYESPAVERVLGYTPSERVGTQLDNIHPEDVPTARRMIHQALSDPFTQVRFGARLRHRDATYRHLELVATNLRDDPAVGGLVFNYRDVTAQVQAQAERDRQYRAVERARGEADATLDAAGEAMALVTPQGTVARVNRRFVEFFAVSAVDVTGRPIHRFREDVELIFEEPARFAAVADAASRGEGAGLSETLVQRWPGAPGARRELHATTTPVRGAGGEHLGHLVAFRDVTHEREVDRMKSDFVSLVSHELRTPLTSIRGYVDLMLEGEGGELTADQREFLEIVAGNARRLVNLINDLLDIARIESGKIALNVVRCDMGGVIQDVVAALRPALDAKRQWLAVEIGPDLPPIDGDPDRLNQVLTNLLSNAHKYTPPEGRIRIGALADGDGRSLRVEIQDSGVGIAPEDRARLFTKFFRARNRATREAGGTGLGLAIARSVIELHGGWIEVVSAAGEGATFTVILPAAEPEPAAAEDQPRATEELAASEAAQIPATAEPASRNGTSSSSPAGNGHAASPGTVEPSDQARPAVVGGRTG